MYKNNTGIKIILKNFSVELKGFLGIICIIIAVLTHHIHTIDDVTLQKYQFLVEVSTSTMIPKTENLSK